MIRSGLSSTSIRMNSMWDLITSLSPVDCRLVDVKGHSMEREEEKRMERKLFTCYAATSDESVSGPKKQPEEAAFLLGVPIKLLKNDKYEAGTREKKGEENIRRSKGEISYKKGIVSYQALNDITDTEAMEVVLSMGLNKLLLVKSEVIRINDSLRKHLELEEKPEAQFVVFCQSSEEFLVQNNSCHPNNKKRISDWVSCVSQMSKAQGAPRVWFHSFKTLPASAQILFDSYNKVSEIENEEEKTKEQTRIAMEIFSMGEYPLVQSASYLVDEYQNRVEEGVLELRENGITMAMITGDSSRAAQEIAQAIGMPESVIVEAESCRELLDFITQHLKKRDGINFEEAKTFIFDRKHTEFIREAIDTVEDSRGVWSFIKRRLFGDIRDHSVLSLHRTLLASLYSLFHLSDPETGFKLHHSVWARSLPFQKPLVVKFFEKTCGMPSLFAGDGINDLMAIEKASVSVGIRGTETPIVARTASFATDEWFPIVNMILTKGPETTAMLTTTVKIIWVKHALTSWSLEALAVLHSFDSFIEPYASQLMMAYNAATFFNIIAHVVSDVLEPEQARNLRSKNMFSVRSWFRWLFVGAVFGIITTFALELVFPEVYGGLFDEDVTQPSQSYGSELSREQFGYRMASIHSMLLTTILIFATNQWQKTSASSVFNVIRHQISGLVATTISFLKSLDVSKSGKKRAKLSAEETVENLKAHIESDTRILLHYTHTPFGRLIITLIFIRLLTSYGGVGIISTLTLSAGICLLCWFFMILILHRNSPARLVLHPVSSLKRFQKRYFPSASPRNSPLAARMVQSKKME
eukprot:TRINITY_DN3676_c0_g1_i1.p1 TRINITY_DN3676_c0_g1~~TRINITY_DN3676_c0_g1_i1.p1  ORF type:complete len:810 (-),score=257.19 TRINITY_DN3676_c0_g1_i1:24-2453(-)